MHVDPSPHRVSACPVHFIWDGRGVGRVFVRSGFLGLLLVGVLWSGSWLLQSDPLRTVAWIALCLAAGSWLLGQVLSMWVVTSFRR